MPTKNLGFYDFLDFPLSQVQIQQKIYSSLILNLIFEKKMCFCENSLLS